MHSLVDSSQIACACCAPTIDWTELLTRCLTGDSAAWNEFYEARTPQVCRLVRHFLGPDKADADRVEELVARVWYALVRDEFRLLRRYTPDRGACLGRFLVGVIRCEVRRFTHSESKRLSHYRQLMQREVGVCKESVSSWELGAILNDFATTLGPQELDFLENYLLACPNGQTGRMSAANIWQRRHRLRVKFKRFLENDAQ